jgi:hypothetical protein
MKRLVTLFLPLCILDCGGAGNLTITAATEGNQTTLLPGLSIKIFAEVRHAGGNPAVTWSLSGCATNCGSLSSTTANPVTYTAPQIVSASFNVTVVATAAANSAKTASVTLTIQPLACSSGNEATLIGQYAFVLQGGSNNLGVFGLAGSFTADGTGRIAAGVADISPTSMPMLTIQANGSSYTLGSDNRGCLTLATSDAAIRRFRFAVGSITAGIATKGRIIVFDDASGSGTRAEGILKRQDPTSFTTSSIQGNYVFGSVGSDPSAVRIADLGVFSAMAGVVSSGQLDVNRGGMLIAPVSIMGGIINVAANGRGTIGFSASPSCGICQGDGFGVVLYMVSSQEMVFLSTPGTFPVLTGQMFKQVLNVFDNSALNATSVVKLSSFRTGNPGPEASVGVAMPNGTGAITLVLDTNSAGTFSPLQSANGTYVVSSNGRVTTAGLGNGSAILYLIDSNRGLVLGTGQSVAFGSFDPQFGAPFTDASLSGLFFFGMEGAQLISRVIGVGSINFDGRALYSGTEDDSSPTGLSANQSFTGIPYSFTAAATPPGRGTLDSNGNTTGYIVSATKLVYINTIAAGPRVVVVEK